MSHSDDEQLPRHLREALVLAMKPAELSEARRDGLRERVLHAARATKPADTVTLRADEVAWIDIAPFIQMKLLRRDTLAGNQTALLRMQPGGCVPPHRHAQEEEFVVLEGECHIGQLKLCAGDVHIAAAGSWHEAVTTSTGVLVLLRGEYPMPS